MTAVVILALAAAACTVAAVIATRHARTLDPICVRRRALDALARMHNPPDPRKGDAAQTLHGKRRHRHNSPTKGLSHERRRYTTC